MRPPLLRRSVPPAPEPGCRLRKRGRCPWKPREIVEWRTCRNAQIIPTFGIRSPLLSMEITERSRGTWHVVSVTGRADNTTAESLTAVLSRAAGAHEQVAVDCSAIDYISSAGV